MPRGPRARSGPAHSIANGVAGARRAVVSRGDAGGEARAGLRDSAIELWIKAAYSGMLAVIVLVYVLAWGWKNFLWFSDIGPLATGVAPWLDSSLTPA